MEYAMCTLIEGEKEYSSLLGTAVHELGHSWFQHLLASDETAYPWLDEGFTSYIQDRALAMLEAKEPLNQKTTRPRTHHTIPVQNASRSS